MCQFAIDSIRRGFYLEQVGSNFEANLQPYDVVLQSKLYPIIAVPLDSADTLCLKPCAVYVAPYSADWWTPISSSCCKAFVHMQPLLMNKHRNPTN